MKIIILILFLNSLVYSQLSYNNNTVPVGEIEALMANTGVSGVNSTGSVYYNPAALTQLKGSSLSLSASVYSLYSFKADPFFILGNNELTYEGNGFQSIPSTMVMFYDISDWKFAFSIIIPSKFSYEGLTTFEFEEFNAEFDINQTYNEEFMLFSLSTAKKVSDKLSLGLSTYLQYYSEYSNVDTKFNNLETSTLQSDTKNRTDIGHYSVILNLGAQYQLDDMNFGLSVNLPNIKVYSSADYYEHEFNDENYIRQNFNGLEVNQKTPFEIKLGFNRKINDRLLVATDFSFRNQIEFDLFNIPNINRIRKYSNIYRLSYGTEYILTQKIKTYFGIAYSPSPNSSSYDNNLTYTTFTTGIKLNSKYTESTFGLYYNQAKGESPNFGYVTKEQFTNFGVFLGTNYKF